jgi:electron transfer flavoprotein alpha subunit
MAENQETAVSTLVFSEKPALLYELIAGARALVDHSGGRIIALVLGPRALAQQAIARGADGVFWLGELAEDAIVDNYVPTIARLFDNQRPSALLVGSTRQGKAVAGRLAARFGVTALTDVLQFLFEGGQVQARHMIFGGGALRVDQPLKGPLLATVGPGVFQPAVPDAGRSGEISEVPFIQPAWRARLRERKTRPAAKVNLRGAKRVVCAGRGLARQEDLALVNELADCLSAEVACTRPLAEGLDWLPRERYIGISGATVRPDLYLGVGVSGQVQHLIGMSDARLVVAINKDPSAPIFQQSDYGIAGDLYEVVPALIKAIKERK